MRQIPQRTCTGCMQKKNKNELIRIVYLPIYRMLRKSNKV